MTVRAVAVADYQPRSFVPGKGFCDLPGNPLGRRMRCHANCDWPSAAVVKNHQAIEELEPDGPHHEQIDLYDSSRVITEERLPAPVRASAVV